MTPAHSKTLLSHCNIRPGILIRKIGVISGCLGINLGYQGEEVSYRGTELAEEEFCSAVSFDFKYNHPRFLNSSL